MHLCNAFHFECVTCAMKRVRHIRCRTNDDILSDYTMLKRVWVARPFHKSSHRAHSFSFPICHLQLANNDGNNNNNNNKMAWHLCIEKCIIYTLHTLQCKHRLLHTPKMLRKNVEKKANTKNSIHRALSSHGSKCIGVE